MLGDLNLEPSSPSMLSFTGSQNFVNLIKNKTCFKGTGSCIGLILTNRKYSFYFLLPHYYTHFIFYYHFIYLVMKAIFNCEERKKLLYRNY